MTTRLPIICSGVILLFLSGSLVGRIIWLKTASPYEVLMKAIDSGDINAVKAELDKGTNPNDLPPAQYEPIAPLCATAADGKLDMVKLLLDRGADVNSGDGWDFTPLEAAARNNQIEVMELLLKRGASVNDFGDGGSYSLWRAALEGKLEAVQWLLSHGANPNTKAGGDTLLSVVEDFHRCTLQVRRNEVAAELRKAGANK
jgi:ankyrin repeat protein